MALKPLSAAAATAILAWGSAQAAEPLTADLMNSAGQKVGAVVLTEAPKGVLMRLEIKGLSPGWHGLHFHEVGSCATSDFSSAGPHVHGAGKPAHGLLNAQANETGDLPNIHADTEGAAQAEVFTTLTTLAALRDANGSAVIVHANPDDHTTQPIGGAGPRVACAVVK